MDTKKRSDEELKEYIEKKIAFYESQLNSTYDQVQRGILVSKIDAAKKEIKDISSKKLTPTIKRRIEDPTLGEKKIKQKKNKYEDGRGSVIGVGSGTYTFLL